MLRLARISLILAATCLPGTAMAESHSIGCVMDGAILDCTGNGDSDAARAEALASTVTFAVLRKQLENPDFRKTAAKRETFRLSLERNRAAAQRVATRALRDFRRKRLSEEEFQASQKAFADAVANYRAGMLVYNTGIWNDPVGSEL